MAFPGLMMPPGLMAGGGLKPLGLRSLLFAPAGPSSVAIPPSTVAGDVIVLMASREDGTLIPVVSGFTNLVGMRVGNSDSSRAGRIMFRLADATDAGGRNVFVRSADHYFVAVFDARASSLVAGDGAASSSGTGSITINPVQAPYIAVGMFGDRDADIGDTTNLIVSPSWEESHYFHEEGGVGRFHRWTGWNCYELGGAVMRMTRNRNTAGDEFMIGNTIRIVRS